MEPHRTASPRQVEDTVDVERVGVTPQRDGGIAVAFGHGSRRSDAAAVISLPFYGPPSLPPGKGPMHSRVEATGTVEDREQDGADAASVPPKRAASAEPLLTSRTPVRRRSLAEWRERIAAERASASLAARDALPAEPAHKSTRRDRSDRRSRFARAGLWAANSTLNLALVALIVAGALAAREAIGERAGAGQAAVPAVAEPTPVIARAVEHRTSYVVERRYTGLVEAASSASVGFEVSGRVKAASVSIGDRLEAGAVIGRLSTRRTDAQVMELEAKIEQAEATLVLRRSEAERADALLKRGVGTRATADQARANLLTAEGEVASARSRLKVIEADQEDTTLRAPLGGVVTSVDFAVGDVVAAGAPVVRLVDQASLEARVGVPLDVAGEIAVGDTVRLRLRGDEFDAAVSGLMARVDAGSRTVLVVATLPDGVAVTEGETATLITERSVARVGFWVPLAALVADVRGLFAVQVVETVEAFDGSTPHGRVARAPVQVLYTDGGRAFVSGALRAGDLIVVEGTNRVSPGEAVVAVSETGSIGVGGANVAEGLLGSADPLLVADGAGTGR